MSELLTKTELDELKSEFPNDEDIPPQRKTPKLQMPLSEEEINRIIDSAPPPPDAPPEFTENSGIYIDERGQLRVKSTVFAKWFKKHTDFFFIKSTSATQTLKYIYDKSGVYREVSDDIFKGIIKNKLPQDLQKTNIIKEIFELIRMDESVYVSADEVNADENIINCKSGILHLDTKGITEHDPKILTTVQIPCKLLPELKPPKNEYFLKFLSELSGENGEVMQLLLEFIGLTLSNIKGSRTKKALFLVGEGNTGKSQFRKLLSELIGAENDTSIDLEAIEGRFGTSQLLFKRLAGSNDMKFATVGQLGMFKQLTGGDRIYAEKKGKDGFTMSFNGLLCFCTNQMPKFGGDKGEHVYERFIIVECNNVIPPEKRDPKIIDKLLSERDYIFTLCIEQLYGLIERNYKFAVPEVCRKALNRYKVDNDNVLAFIEECTEYQPLDTVGNGLKTSEVYQIYCDWCSDNSERRVGKKVFVSRLCEIGKGDKRKSNGYEYYTTFKIKKQVIREYWISQQ